MRKIKKIRYEREFAFVADPTIEVFDEYVFSDKHTFTKGDKLKINRQHGTFSFIRYVVNKTRDAEWLDVFDKYGQARAFYTSDIRGPAKVRKRKLR